MLETPHVAVGAAIATKIPNPVIAIPLAFASHFLLEKIPHWNPHLNTEKNKYGKVTKRSTYFVILDTSIALILGTTIAFTKSQDSLHFATILLASFASVLPDVVEGPYFFLNIKHRYIDKWIRFQKSIQCDTTIIPGLFTQFITIIAALWWISSS